MSTFIQSIKRRTKSSKKRRLTRGLSLEGLEARMLLNVDWRNPVDSFDASQDRFVSPIDALLVINELNRNSLKLDSSRALPLTRDNAHPYFDVNGDGFLTPIDALLVINAINNGITGDRRLAEGNGFVKEQTLTISLGQPAGTRHYRMHIDASFVPGVDPGIVPDLFSVYLVDPNLPAQTLLDRGVRGTALLSLTAQKSEVALGFASWDGQVLDIDLSSLSNRDTGLLQLQLLRGDASSGSQVVIRPMSNAVDPEGVPMVPFPAAAASTSNVGGAINLTGLTESTSLETIVNNVRFDAKTGKYAADVQLRNRDAAIGRTVVMLFPGLPAGVTLLNASGTDATGVPYLNLRETIRAGGLGPNATTDTVQLQLQNSSGVSFTLRPRVLVGGPNRAPVLTPVSPLSVIPGASVEVQLQATDADDDPVNFFLRTGGVLPAGRLSPNGTLTFSPKPTQIGSYTLDIGVSDGMLESVQSVTLNVLADPLTSTRVSGRVLDVDGSPLSGIRVEIGAVQGLTSADGSFLLDLGTGTLAADTIKIRGELLTGPENYPFIAEKLPLLLEHEVFSSFDNHIVRPIHLPKLDIAGGTAINPMQDTTVRNAALPGVSVMVKAGTLLNQQGSPFSGVLSITEVPRSLTPAALPENLLPDLVVTVQPGEMVFATPAPMTFPNRSGWASGTLMDLWSINPVTGEFEDVGDMRVSTDGTVIETISGGVRNSSWHFPSPPPPEKNPPEEDKRTKDDRCKKCESSANANSQVQLHSGALMETHDLVPYTSLGQSRGLTLSYDSLRADPRPIVHFGYSRLLGGGGVVYATMALQLAEQWSEVPGFNATIIQDPRFGSYPDLLAPRNSHYWRETSGSLDVALQSDLRQQPSGRYTYSISVGLGRITPLPILGASQLNGNASSSFGNLISVNTIHSPFGAGWGLNGLQQLIENSDKSLLLVDGDGGEQVYESRGIGLPYRSPPGDFSTMEKLSDGRFRQKFPDQTVVFFNSQGLLESTTDRIGNTTSYLYDTQGLLQKIVDPVGLETRFDYVADRLATITDPADRVTSMQYDVAGNLTRIIDPDGSFRTFQYDSDHHMVGEIDKRDVSERAEYGFHGRVVNVTRKDGTRSFFDPVQVQGLLPPKATTNPFSPPVVKSLGPAVAKYTDGSGNTVAKTLDQAGQEIDASDGVGRMPTYERDGSNLITKVRNGRAQETQFNYDVRGNLTLVSDELTSVSSGDLFPHRTYEVGNGPTSVVIADVDGDGDLDMVTANSLANNVSVLKNIGDGTYAPQIIFGVGGGPSSIAAMDVDGDGDVDLLVANRTSNNVSVLKNNGDGTFETHVTYGVGTAPQSVAVADIDGDGDVDMVVANSGDGKVSVLRNNGDGTFATHVIYQVGSNPGSAVLADVDGDGDVDLVVANRGASNNVSVLMNNGDGTFASQLTIGAGLSSPVISATLADVDGDGDQDLVFLMAGAVSVLKNNGNGTFATPVPLNLLSFLNPSLPVAASAMSVADLDGDGDVDVAVANTSDNSVLLLKNSGDGTFTFYLFFSFPAGASPASLAVADLDGNGVVEMIIANRQSNSVSVVKNYGAIFFHSHENNYKVGGTPISLAAADLDGDGDLDVVSAIVDNGKVSVLLNIGNGSFATQVSYGVGIQPFSLALADFDGDNDVDLVVANAISNNVSVLKNNGDGTFAAHVTYGVGSFPGSVAVADIDGDGDIDLVVANGNSGNASVLKNNGDGTFATHLTYGVGNGPGSLILADIDADGDMDLVVANGSGSTVSVLKNNGDGTFATHVTYAAGSGPTSVAVADLDGDGDADIAVVTSGDSVSVLKNNGDGTFASLKNYDVGAFPFSLAVADIDGDGDIDLVVANVNGDNVSLLKNNGDGTFAPHITHGVGRTPESVIVADIDGDGDADIVVAASGEGKVTVLRNIGGTSGPVSLPRRYEYDIAFSQITRATDELGRVLLYEIDPANGNRLSERRIVGLLDSASNGEVDDVVTRYTYIATGLVDTITDPLNRVTDFDYDARGRLTKVTRARGTVAQTVVQYEYDPGTAAGRAGKVTAFVDANGSRTQFEYDAMNRLVRTIEPDPDGAAGPLTSPVTSLAYDAAGNLIQSIDALGHVTHNEYDARNRLVRRIEPDPDGTSGPLAAPVTQSFYDNAGNVTKVMDSLGHGTTYQYDARNRLVKSIDPDGGVTSFTYDSDDNLATLTDAVNNRTRFVYDQRNRLVTEQDPLGSPTRYMYDAVNNLTGKTDRNGRVTQYAYDSLNRRIRETWVGASGNDNVLNYAYDKVGNLLSASDKQSSLVYTYDTLDRVRTVDNRGSEPANGTPGAPRVVLTYQYDNSGNVLSVADNIRGADAGLTQYGYDALDRMTRVQQSGIGVSEKRVDLEYNAYGQFAKISRYADLAGTQSVVTSSYAYDALNRLKSLVHRNASTDVAFYNYSYDVASRITRIVDIDGPTNYSYDNRDQLTAADHTDPNNPDEFFKYDANGNRVSSHLHGSSYQTGTGNRLLSDGTFNYQYDAEGNLILRTEIATGNYREFKWDFRNRLIAVTDKTAANVAMQKATYSYDAIDRRISKSIDTTPEDAIDAVFSHFVYDRDNVILEFTDVVGNGPAAPILDVRYLHGPAVDQLFGQEISAGNVLWQLSDHLGTIRDLVDDTAVAVTHFVYDSYGNLTFMSNSMFDSRYQFTGREFDAEAKANYYRARYYDAAIGRFISNDPITFNGNDTNLFRYVLNDPIRFRDPSGEVAPIVIGAAIGAVVGGFGSAYIASQSSCSTIGNTFKSFAIGAFGGALTGIAATFAGLGASLAVDSSAGLLAGAGGAANGSALASLFSDLVGIGTTLGTATDIIGDRPCSCK